MHLHVGARCVRAHVCVYACMRLCVYAFLCVCMHAYVCVCMRLCVYACLCVCVCMHACVCVRVCVCACLCLCACVCVYACLCLCVCVRGQSITQGDINRAGLNVVSADQQQTTVTMSGKDEGIENEHPRIDLTSLISPREGGG